MSEEISGSVAQDAMTLREHDLHYHDGNYRGGKCKFREEMEKSKSSGDLSDSELDRANQQEGTIYSARRYEGRMLEEAIAETFKIGQKLGTRVQFLEPDKDGMNQLMVWGNASMSDDFFNEGKLRDMCWRLGYDYRGISVYEEKKSSGARMGKPKKIYAIDLFRPENYRFAEESPVVEVRHEGSEGEMEERDKNRVLKRYGMISEGGKVRRRTPHDDYVDTLNRYLGIKE